MLSNIQGAIFDLDGTLIDSMWIWDKIDCEYLLKRNIEVPDNLKDTIGHLSFDEVAIYFKNTFELQDSTEEIKQEWLDMALSEYKSNTPLKPGVLSFLDILKKSGIKIGLATSNCHLLLESALKANNIYDYFDAITITDEVTRGKNHPDVYLLAAEKLKVNPENCIVFEDILPALEGAKKAGMKVVCIHDDHNEYKEEDILELADHYINSYENLAL